MVHVYIFTSKENSLVILSLCLKFCIRFFYALSSFCFTHAVFTVYLILFIAFLSLLIVHSDLHYTLLAKQRHKSKSLADCLQYTMHLLTIIFAQILFCSKCREISVTIYILTLIYAEQDCTSRCTLMQFEIFSLCMTVFCHKLQVVGHLCKWQNTREQSNVSSRLG